MATYKTSDTLPETAADSAFVAHYFYVWQADPRWLRGLRRDDGSLYLPKPTKQRRAQTSQQAAA